MRNRLYESTDLVLNFKRQIICKYSEIQKNETSSCRLATLDEIKLYNLFGKTKLKFVDVINSNYQIRQKFQIKVGESRSERNRKKDNVIIYILVNRFLLIKIHKLIKENKFNTYSEVINFFSYRKEFCTKDIQTLD